MFTVGIFAAGIFTAGIFIADIFAADAAFHRHIRIETRISLSVIISGDTK